MKTLEQKLRGVIETDVPEHIAMLRIYQIIGWYKREPRFKKIPEGKAVMIMADEMSKDARYRVKGRTYQEHKDGVHFY